MFAGVFEQSQASLVFVFCFEAMAEILGVVKDFYDVPYKAS
jgi:hypothetical protein